MINTIASNGEVNYGVNEYIIDNNTELNQIPQSAAAGSTAYSIEDGKSYIKNNKNQWIEYQLNKTSGGGIINLPDNIIYSYDMTEEEFWNNYNNGLLNDGFYNYFVEEFDFKTFNTLEFDGHLGYTVEYYKDMVILHYSGTDNIICLDQFGNIINQTYFSNPQDQYVDNNCKIISDNGYFYLTVPTEEDSNSIFALDLNTFNTHTITFDQEINGPYYDGWQFKLGIYNDNLNDLKTSLGGTFAIARDYTNGHIIYILDNMIKGSVETPENQYTIDTTVNYEQNELYKLVYDENNDIKLLIVNSNCEYQVFDLFSSNSGFSVFDWPGQLFFHNDILYGHLFTDSTLYCFLFDTITKKIIQLEEFYLEGNHYERTILREYNNIYKNNDYAVLHFIVRPDYFNTGISYFIKINYNEEYSYINLIQLEDFYFENPLNLKKYIANEQRYFSKDYKIYSLNLQDCSIKDVGTGSLRNIEDSSYFVLSNNDLIAVSYDLNNDNLLGIRIDNETGTISQMVNVSSLNSKGNVFEVREKDNLFTYRGIVCDLATLQPLYTINNKDYPTGFLKIQLKDKILWGSENNNLGCFDFVNKNIIHIVNKNNILLTEHVYE